MAKRQAKPARRGILTAPFAGAAEALGERKTKPPVAGGTYKPIPPPPDVAKPGYIAGKKGAARPGASIVPKIKPRKKAG